jgi:hypothetical protein
MGAPFGDGKALDESLASVSGSRPALQDQTARETRFETGREF